MKQRKKRDCFETVTSLPERDWSEESHFQKVWNEIKKEIVLNEITPYREWSVDKKETLFFQRSRAQQPHQWLFAPEREWEWLFASGAVASPLFVLLFKKIDRVLFYPFIKLINSTAIVPRIL